MANDELGAKCDVNEALVDKFLNENETFINLIDNGFSVSVVESYEAKGVSDSKKQEYMLLKFSNENSGEDQYYVVQYKNRTQELFVRQVTVVDFADSDNYDKSAFNVTQCLSDLEMIY